MSSDLLDLELRLLIARHGRERVMDRLLHLSPAPHDTLENAVSAFEAKQRSSAKRNVKSAEDIASELQLDEPRREAVRSLARRYDKGTFLGSMREVSSLLSRAKNAPPVIRSRKAAAAAVVRFLASLSPEVLGELIRELDENVGKSDYHRLAERILGRRDK